MVSSHSVNADAFSYVLINYLFDGSENTIIQINVKIAKYFHNNPQETIYFREAKFSSNTLIVKFRDDMMLKKDVLLSNYDTDGFSFGDGVHFHEIRTMHRVHVLSMRF